MKLSLASLLVIATASAATPTPYLFQKPTMNRTQLVFVYAGDLWSVPRQGGDARRLTAGAGVETDPVFSPDGSLLAFTGNYDGGTDVFVMAAEGGVPKRLTWHPAPDIVLGWTPDGSRVLFTSPRTSYSRFSELFTVSKNGGFEEKVPVPMGFEASFSPDGKRLAYVPLSRAFAAWKRYRGGRTAPIWLANLDTGHIEKVPRSNSNDYNPMWAGDKLYFLSDRSGPVSLFAYDTKSRQVKQLVPNDGLDFKSASAGPGGIVYEQFGSIHIYDFKSAKSETVPIRLTGDLPEVRERLVDAGKRLSNAHISPTGARAVFEARGEIVTIPAEKGDARNLTNTPGINERDPAWSPDGKTIAYFSDESGEYELHLRAQNGMGEPVRIKLGDPPAFYFDPRWSPDNKKIAYRDCHLGLWYVDLDDKKPVRIAKDLYYPGTEMTPAWSPDSQWIAYTRRLKNYLGAIFVYSIGGATSTQITDGMSDTESPVFDKDGKYLYFTSSTDSGPSLEPDLHSAQRTVSRSIYLVVLDKSQASPFSPESDDEPHSPSVSAGDAHSPSVSAGDGHSPSVSAGDAHNVPVKIDFDKIGQRILAVPMPARRYVDLQIGKPGVLFAVEGAGFGRGLAPGTTVHRFDLKSRKSDVAIAGVRGFEISQNGEKMLYQQADRWTIAALRPIAASPAPGSPPAAPAANPGANVLKTDSIEVRSDPKLEWKQMYHEAWRIERDFFYDPGFHGYDLVAAEKKYAPYLENIGSRNDLNYLLAEMLGEMTVGHLSVVGGDQPAVKRVQTGLLGADYKIENGRYRFDRVFDGENWNPQLRAPLTQPGVNVAAGDYLLAVNGRELRAADNVYSFFEATADKSVVLKVGPDASGAGSREVTVVPLGTETGLRNLAWIEDNRRKVDRITNGRVAYVYMPDTGFGGLTNFNRYFFAQVGKEAVIVDERFNGGGALATDIIEYLKRPLMSLAATRDGMDEQQPQGAIFGPKVMIVNEFAGSGGDAMPWYFKRAGLGKLVGKRTWGGLVGRAGAPPLMDGGMVTAPASGIWNPNGQWEVENQGIAPDIEVEHDPELVRQGRDPQLEKAVEVVMEELKRQPAPVPKRPDYPNYHKKAL